MTVVGHGLTVCSDVRLNICVSGASSILFDFFQIVIADLKSHAFSEQESVQLLDSGLE